MLKEIAARPQLSGAEYLRIVEALASDDRKEEIWEKVAAWPDAQITYLTRSAFLYATPYTVSISV
jgi:hypothetical protein